MRWDGSIEELPVGARVTVEMATGVQRTGTVTGNGAAANGFGEWTDVAMDHLDPADAVERFHRSRVTPLSCCPRCNGHHKREGDAEEKCQRETQFARADHRRRGGVE